MKKKLLGLSLAVMIIFSAGIVYVREAEILTQSEIVAEIFSIKPRIKYDHIKIPNFSLSKNEVVVNTRDGTCYKLEDSELFSEDTLTVEFKTEGTGSGTNMQVGVISRDVYQSITRKELADNWDKYVTSSYKISSNGTHTKNFSGLNGYYAVVFKNVGSGTVSVTNGTVSSK